MMRLSDRSGRRLTMAGGLITAVFGAIHVVVAPLEGRPREIWSDAIDAGWWNTFTLDEATTVAELERSETLWVSMASWGLPILVLGCYIVWSTRRRHRVPGWIGWIMAVWGVLFATALPGSPAWLFIVAGGLIALGDRRRHPAVARRAAPAAS